MLCRLLVQLKDRQPFLSFLHTFEARSCGLATHVQRYLTVNYTSAFSLPEVSSWQVKSLGVGQSKTIEDCPFRTNGKYDPQYVPPGQISSEICPPLR